MLLLSPTFAGSAWRAGSTARWRASAPPRSAPRSRSRTCSTTPAEAPPASPSTSPTRSATCCCSGSSSAARRSYPAGASSRGCCWPRGYALNTVGDVFNVLGTTSHLGAVLNDIAWPVAILLVSIAVWVRTPTSRPLVSEEPPGFALPALAAASALLILFVGSMHHVGGVSLGLAAATLADRRRSLRPVARRPAKPDRAAPRASRSPTS